MGIQVTIMFKMELRRLARLPRLGTANTYFLLRIVNNLPLTEELTAKTSIRDQATCQYLGCTVEINDSQHALVHWVGNIRVGNRVLGYLQSLMPGVETVAAIKPKIHVDEC